MMVILVPPPRCCQGLGLAYVGEHLGVQQLAPQPRVETLGVYVFEYEAYKKQGVDAPQLWIGVAGRNGAYDSAGIRQDLSVPLPKWGMQMPPEWRERQGWGFDQRAPIFRTVSHQPGRRDDAL